MISILALFFSPFFALATIEVKVSFMEALAPKDTTSSQRFQTEYDLAIQTAKDLLKDPLKKCGYTLSEEKSFYSASDPLQALEQAKHARESGAWLIVGPRRSNHYLLAVKGAEDVPSISIMASSKDIYELSPLHLTMAQPNEKMARSLVSAAKHKSPKGKRYISIVSEDCVTCTDFAKSFDTAAESHFTKIHEIKITGEQPELIPIEIAVKKYAPDFILIPNYSKVSSYLIGAIQRIKSSVTFLGADGWGDNQFGFVHSSQHLTHADGITVKSFPPLEVGLKFFPLGKMIASKDTSLTSASGLALLRTLEGLKDLLCSAKPQNKNEFAKAFERDGSRHFSNPWGTSIFRLANGKIEFEKVVR